MVKYISNSFAIKKDFIILFDIVDISHCLKSIIEERDSFLSKKIKLWDKYDLDKYTKEYKSSERIAEYIFIEMEKQLNIEPAHFFLAGMNNLATLIDQTIAALEAGKAVFCEKPMGMTREEIERIAASVECNQGP